MHPYFDNFTEEFEEEIQALLQLDANEFHKNKLRAATKERIDENNILSPRSPKFASSLMKGSNKNDDLSGITGTDTSYKLHNQNKYGYLNADDDTTNTFKSSGFGLGSLVTNKKYDSK